MSINKLRKKIYRYLAISLAFRIGIVVWIAESILDALGIVRKLVIVEEILSISDGIREKCVDRWRKWQEFVVGGREKAIIDGNIRPP